LIELIGFIKTWKNHPSKIGNFLNKKQATLSYHFKKLKELEIIHTIPKGNETLYGLKNPEEIYDILITNKESIFNENTSLLIDYIISKKDKYDEDKILELILHIIFDIFPHPYHV
jgi:DNA-binding transcriptional ArsR family regulator